jgi:hypothetical protein
LVSGPERWRRDFGRTFDDVELRIPISGGLIAMTTVTWLKAFFENEKA